MMKRIALATALGSGLVGPAAHAAISDPWVVVVVGDPVQGTPGLTQALISTDHFPNANRCFEAEGVIIARFLKEHYIVWCAQVPGLHQ